MECDIVFLLTIFCHRTFSHMSFLSHQTKEQHCLVKLAFLNCQSVVFFSELWVIAVLKTFTLLDLHAFRFQELSYAFNGDGVNNSFFYEVFLKFRKTPRGKMQTQYFRICGHDPQHLSTLFFSKPWFGTPRFASFQSF